MAIKAGLVGVNPKGVDKNGMPIGSGGANVEAEIQQINLDIAQLQASKVGIGQLTANNKAFNFAYDSTTEKYGYKLDGTGDFIPFESAGGGPGWVEPANLSHEALTLTDNIDFINGGFVEIDGIIYVDMTYHKTNGSIATFSGLPVPAINTAVTMVGYRTSTEQSDNNDYFANADVISDHSMSTSGVMNDGKSSAYVRIIGMYKKHA